MYSSKTDNILRGTIRSRAAALPVIRDLGELERQHKLTSTTTLPGRSACSTLSHLTMASALRPTLLRQAFAAAPAKRTFSSAVSAAPRFRQQLLRPAVQQSIIRQALPCTAFSTSQKRDILPPLPQKISGTVNDAARVPDAAPSHGSYHWTFERYDMRAVAGPRSFLIAVQTHFNRPGPIDSRAIRSRLAEPCSGCCARCQPAHPLAHWLPVSRDFALCTSQIQGLRMWLDAYNVADPSSSTTSRIIACQA